MESTGYTNECCAFAAFSTVGITVAARSHNDRVSPSQRIQSSSTSPGETNKLIIGLVIAVVIPVLLGTMALAYHCFVRRRRRRKYETATGHQGLNNANDDGENSQLYFQQKVELDDEQRRHEMEAVEVRHEMQGEDEIHEMPAD